ncbi:hypothetical protein LWI29_025698 [Acer saccharum]|uniref:Uncharacterized protein n=1 Tax=Acer saccharum TaxID=4024 RepID=A0AA39REG2_ACESA|nr:hypothetical protein LWI29_025698 [Acer saccharum]
MGLKPKNVAFNLSSEGPKDTLVIEPNHKVDLCVDLGQVIMSEVDKRRSGGSYSVAETEVRWNGAAEESGASIEEIIRETFEAEIQRKRDGKVNEELEEVVSSDNQGLKNEMVRAVIEVEQTVEATVADSEEVPASEVGQRRRREKNSIILGSRLRRINQGKTVSSHGMFRETTTSNGLPTMWAKWPLGDMCPGQGLALREEEAQAFYQNRQGNGQGYGENNYNPNWRNNQWGVNNRESNPKLSLGNNEGLVEFLVDNWRTPFIKHESFDSEEIIAQLKEENRALKAINFELTTKLEDVLKGQDELVEECTTRVSNIEEEALQRDQLMRDKEELSIAKKAKGKKVDHLCNQWVDKGKQSKVMREHDVGTAAPPPRRATTPEGASEHVPEWGRTLTTMVRDLTLEFRSFWDGFGSDGTYTRRAPYHPRKRTRTEGPSSFDGIEPEHYTHPPPPYQPGPSHAGTSAYSDPFDLAAEFQMMSPYSPTALIPYPTPLRMAKQTKDMSDPDATDSESDSD